MAEEIAVKVIARIHTDFPEKFGIPRQSGLIEELKSTIVFEPEFRDANALRGIEEYSHLWLIWEFSEAVRDTWSPMVRPPRLGGNKRVGVFATRSPFRPNPIGLSSVKLERVEQHPALGPVLHLSGADLMDGTPILDIKPYLPHVDSHVEALGSFTEKTKEYFIPVEIPDELLEKVPADHRAALKKVLGEDVNQKGSNITEERLRFDFNFPRAMTEEEIKATEALVNEKIKENIPVEMKEISLAEAKEAGFTGLFESKYGEVVKTYTIGDFSREICGGPHAESTGELGEFKIVKEQSCGAGTRRIKAVLVH